MSLPDKNAPWPQLVTYFKNNKKDGENLGIVLKRASAYRKTGKVPVMKEGMGSSSPMVSKRRTKRTRGGKKSKSDKRR